MPEETDAMHVAVRLKLSSGVKPSVVIENLVRAGWPREQVVSAVAAEAEALKTGARREFKFIHTRKSLLDRIVDGAIPILAGLGLMAVGVVLSFLFSALTFGAERVVFIGLIATGFVITLYGLASAGEE
jgi:hypothetical protein